VERCGDAVVGDVTRPGNQNQAEKSPEDPRTGVTYRRIEVVNGGFGVSGGGLKDYNVITAKARGLCWRTERGSASARLGGKRVTNRSEEIAGRP